MALKKWSVLKVFQISRLRLIDSKVAFDDSCGSDESYDSLIKKSKRSFSFSRFFSFKFSSGDSSGTWTAD